MSTVIHMEPEQVRSVAQQLNALAETIKTQGQSISIASRNLDWSGGGRDAYVAEMDSVTRSLKDMGDAASLLSLRVQHEVDEWEYVDRDGQALFAGIGAIIEGIAGSIRGIIARVVDYQQGVTEFKQWWEQLTDSQKEMFLNEQQKIIAQRYGIDPIQIKIEDLPDVGGLDARGRHRGDVLIIDIDNLKSDSPQEILETLAHETRHEIQETYVERYEQTGEIPEGVTKEQIDAWSENMKPGNYIQPKDDFEGYYKQPIERDARDFADDYVEDVVHNRGWNDTLINPVQDTILEPVPGNVA